MVQEIINSIGMSLKWNPDAIKLQQEFIGMLEKMRNLEAENADLKEQLRLRSITHFRDDKLYVILDGGKEDGPYCSTCMEADSKLIHLIDSRLRDISGAELLQCWRCKVMVPK